MTKPVRYPKISIAIYKDPSLEGCVVSMGNVSKSVAWLPDEKLIQINVSFLELKVFSLALTHLIKTPPPPSGY